MLLGDQPVQIRVDVPSVAPEVAAGGKELARQPRVRTDITGHEHRPFPLFITRGVCSSGGAEGCPCLPAQGHRRDLFVGPSPT